MHIFVTGASGFIARHIVLALLKAGHRVTGSVRSHEKAHHVRASMAHHMGAPVDENRLEFEILDLMREDGWPEALQGKDALIHTASPVPVSRPRDADEIVRPAVEGTRRAMNGAFDAGIGTVVLTSSEAAIRVRHTPVAAAQLTEADWSDLTAPHITPYEQAKTKAERAAWECVADKPHMGLATINPAWVFGPPLDDDFGTSLMVIQRILRARDPAWPRICIPVVDVRDVAELHVRALTDPAMQGQRTVAFSGSVWLRDIAAMVKTEFPDLRISSRHAPDWLVRLLGQFDPSVGVLVPELAYERSYDIAHAQAALGRTFRSPEEAVIASARVIQDKGWF